MSIFLSLYLSEEQIFLNYLYCFIVSDSFLPLLYILWHQDALYFGSYSATQLRVLLNSDLLWDCFTL